MDSPSMSQAAPALSRSGLDPVLRQWQMARRGRPVPARTDLDPRLLQPWLSLAGIVEHARNGHVRFRLGGAGLGALLGVEARGMPLRSLFAVAARPRLGALTATVFDSPAALILSGIATDPGDGPALKAEMALLPLSDAAGAVTRALFCLAPEDPEAALRPCRFHLSHAHLVALAPVRPSGTEKGPAPVLQVIRGGRDRAPA